MGFPVSSRTMRPPSTWAGMGAMASKILCDTQRACPSLLWSTTSRPRTIGSLSISSWITRGSVHGFAWIRNQAYGGGPLLCRPIGVIPPPALYEVRNVVKDRVVCLDVVGNLLHGLCRFAVDVRRVFRTLYDAKEMAPPSAFRASSMGICLWAPYSRA